jgi:tetratricopeptide (TPR) repeat protein
MAIWIQRIVVSALALAAVVMMVPHYLAEDRAAVALVTSKLAEQAPIVAQALAWDDRQPVAYRLQGLAQLARAKEHDAVGDTALAERARADAEQSLRRAVALDPLDTQALSALALLAQQRGQEDEAERLARSVHRLAPVNWWEQRNLAELALKQSRWSDAAQHMANAMAGSSTMQQGFFPLMAQFLQTEEGLDVMRPLTQQTERYRWWMSFYRYAMGEIESIAALEQLVRLREQATEAPITPTERDLFIARLRRDGLIPQAYVQWVRGLSPVQGRYLGYIFDGGFELPAANDAGFGWWINPPRNSGIRIAQSSAYGAGGNQALRLEFSGKRVRFSHVRQALFLQGGHRYRLEGRVRPDGLQARKGLEWVLRCSYPDNTVVAQTTAVRGTGDWTDFSVEFDLDETCLGQLLQLQSAGRREVDHELKGSIWFDDMRVVRVDD